MKKTIKTFALLCAMLLSTGAWGATDVTSFCRYQLVSGNSKPLMTWETNHQGDVIITLEDGIGSTNTRFRGNGMSDGLSTFYIVNSTKGDQKEAKNYFTSELTSNQFILRRRQDVAWPEGGYYIKFYDKYVQWLCKENDNAAQQVNCYFPYGDICGTLAQPVVSSLSSDGTITFGAVADATSYVARVYLGGELQSEQSIVSGGKISYNAWKTATHEVTVQALSADNYSKESAGTDWSLTGDIKYLPKSQFCGTDYMISKPNETKANAYVTIETKKGKDSSTKDTVVFTISDATGSDKPNAYWRSNGLNQNGLLYDGQTFTNYFQLVESPANQTKIRYVKKDAVTVEFGKYITYNIGVNAQSAEWATSGDNNAAANTMSFKYIYGTNCDDPEPTIVDPESITIAPASASVAEGQSTNLTATVLPANATDKSVTWSSDKESIATVTAEGVVSGISAGTAVITATSTAKSSILATCTVTVTAPVLPTAIELNYSSVSVAINGSLTVTANVLPAEATNKSVTWSSSVPAVATVANGVLTLLTKGTTTITATSVAAPSVSASCSVTVTDPQSEYCETTMTAPSNGHPANYTWMTNENGDIFVTISPAGDDLDATWAGNALGADANAFRFGKKGDQGLCGKDYFNNPTHDSHTCTLTVKQGATHPEFGTKLYYSFTAEVPFNYTDKDGKSHYAHGHIDFEYTYGSTCTFAPSSVVLSQSAVEMYATKSKTITASVLPSLATQTVTWSTSNASVATVSNGTITGVAAGTATIRATSTENEMAYAECAVTVTALPSVGESEYCLKVMKNGNDSAKFTWETDNDGNVIITLADAKDPTYNAVFRSGNEAFLGAITVNGVADTYFTKVGNNTNQFKLQLKNPAVAPAFGAQININGGVQINVKSNNNAAPSLNFTYTYGSVCNVHLYESKDNAPMLNMFNGQTKKVVINRNFVADGYNYTLCLPFDMDADQCLAVFGDGYKLYKMGEPYMKSADVMYLPFDLVDAVEAGVPYLFCPLSNVSTPTINSVVIDAAAPQAIGNTLATMTGVYSPTALDGSQYVLGDENWLHLSNSGNMYGLRSYFNLTPSSSSPVRARAVFNDHQMPTDLNNANANVNANRKMIIDGRLVIMRNGVMYNAQGQIVK